MYIRTIYVNVNLKNQLKLLIIVGLLFYYNCLNNIIIIGNRDYILFPEKHLFR